MIDHEEDEEHDDERELPEFPCDIVPVDQRQPYRDPQLRRGCNKKEDA